MSAGIVVDVSPDGVIGIEFGAASMNLDELNRRAEIHVDSEATSTAAEIEASWNAALAELYRRHPDAVLDPEPGHWEGIEVFTATWQAYDNNTSHERDHAMAGSDEDFGPYVYTVINGEIVYAHDFLMGMPAPGYKCIHVNGDTTDNRTANLAHVPESDPRPGAPRSGARIGIPHH